MMAKNTVVGDMVVGIQTIIRCGVALNTVAVWWYGLLLQFRGVVIHTVVRWGFTNIHSFGMGFCKFGVSQNTQKCV